MNTDLNFILIKRAPVFGPFRRPSILVIVLSCSCILLSGCGGTYVGTGEEEEVDNSAEVFLAAGGGKHIPIPEPYCQRLTEGYQWVLPRGMELIEGNIEASCGKVHWSDGGYDYSAEGVNIKAKGKIRVQEDCCEGTYWLSVALPVLSKLSDETNTTPIAAVWKWTLVIVFSTQSVKPAPTMNAGIGKVHAFPIQLYHVKASVGKAWLWAIGTVVIVLALTVLIIALAGRD